MIYAFTILCASLTGSPQCSINVYEPPKVYEEIAVCETDMAAMLKAGEKDYSVKINDPERGVFINYGCIKWDQPPTDTFDALQNKIMKLHGPEANKSGL